MGWCGKANGRQPQVPELPYLDLSPKSTHHSQPLNLSAPSCINAAIIAHIQGYFRKAQGRPQVDTPLIPFHIVTEKSR